jgi:hypothetical protein
MLTGTIAPLAPKLLSPGTEGPGARREASMPYLV